MTNIPIRCQVLVIGGGPAGSYAAAALANEGVDVVLLESSKFPRYHIGESLLPSVRPLLDFIGALGKIECHGFCPKVHGIIPTWSAVKFNQHKREGYTDFVALDPTNVSWNVVRSEFDDILLRHASVCGANVIEKVKVTSIEFEDNDPMKRPIAAHYKSTDGSKEVTGEIKFEFLVDASGRAGLMSTRYLKNRKFNHSLTNIAIWGYWTGCQRYSPGTTRENAIWVEALTDETGWAWFIPLSDGTVSIGVVQDQNRSASKKQTLRATRSGDISLEDFYLDELKRSPGVIKYMGENAVLVKIGKDGGEAVKQASDYSYSAHAYSGVGWRSAGDAAAFIDPFFSSGVHLAMASGLSAAATIVSSLKGVADEKECATWHDVKVGTAYTRFLLVVLGAYKQMRAQDIAVLSDINEDNFDRAFDLIRPIIQGTADVNKKLTHDEVEKTMDFVKNVFAPTDPEMHAAVEARVDPKFFHSKDATDILLPSDLDRIFGKEDEDVKHVLGEINARKPIHKMYDVGTDFGSEAINGYTIKLERGQLGMVKVEA
ncbi:FAD/NAD-P-binding domain-containing protein [Rhodocollybia butyracea]|uniref:FAD/NAD-P-binding domain-containing protein n=1 Tax=Rhodocollybia butyracea TaxID=206335 RepID=A0A9P5PVR4_9AGAR|nr:FAD/NAD-P-binding domain-containing protein [Rhodocollybia butyracea]